MLSLINRCLEKNPELSEDEEDIHSNILENVDIKLDGHKCVFISAKKRKYRGIKRNIPRNQNVLNKVSLQQLFVLVI